MNEQEKQAIALCQEGKLENFTVLYDAYAKKIYQFLYHRTLHRPTAEDLTSEVFFKALDKISTFNSTKASFSTWLYQIARNTLIDYFRSHHPNMDIEAAWDLSTGQNVETDTDNKLKMEAVQKSLSTLNPQQRQIVTLRLWDDLSHKEIAEILGISEANSKMTFSRALSKLQTEMGVSNAIAILLVSLIKIV